MANSWIIRAESAAKTYNAKLSQDRDKPTYGYHVDAFVEGAKWSRDMEWQARREQEMEINELNLTIDELTSEKERLEYELERALEAADER